jgi:hypothetical protein
MREKAARKITSGWSAFRLGMTRPELTLLAIGEWDRPEAGSEWGVVVRDLRTGNERVVFNEDEWELIKRKGLPAVGVEWGELVPAPPKHDALRQQAYMEARPIDIETATPAEVEAAGSTEQYGEAVLNAALTFADSVRKVGGRRKKAEWLAEREVGALYLGALEAWMHRLSDDDIDWLISEMCAYLGAGAVPVEKIDDENLMLQSTVDMEEVLKARVADYGDLLLATPLTSSADLRKAFSLRVRAEVGGAADVEQAAARLFDELPDLKPQLVAQRFLSRD